MKKETGYRWKFFKAGSAYQASINSVEDIENIGMLDRKLWSTLACPTSGLFFDSKLLQILDADTDGRIRYGDVVAATQWTCSMLKDRSTLLDGADGLKISNIDDSSDEGKTLVASARTVLSNLGKSESDEVCVADFADTTKIFANSAFNADGVITELSCGGDASLEALFADILSVSAPKKDRSGRDGINADDVKNFFDGAKAQIAWLDSKSAAFSASPLGAATDGAYASFAAVKDKIDDFFTRCDIVRFDQSAASVVNAGAERFAKILSENVGDGCGALADLPVAFVSGADSLDLSGDVNPVWRKALADFAENAAKPVCGTTAISKANWLEIKAVFAPYSAWLGANPNAACAKIPEARLREILAQDKSSALLAALEADAAVAAEVAEIAKLEKLVRLNKSLCSLLRNFVSFQEFYKDKTDAIFQFGKLYIDGRMCSLCIKVDDVAKHSAMAAMSYGYLLYCVCKRKGESDLNVVAVVTAGDSDNLIVGKNGVFYDRNGRDWDATVTKIVDNPIGIAQAFFSPYKRFLKWASEQIAKRALAADQNVAAGLEKGKIVDEKTKKIDIGTVAALGVAVGGITTAFGVIVGAFVKLGVWMPLGIIGVLLAISLPSMIIAAMKLSQRNLAPLLDGNGWAINNKANVNILFGAHLTQTPKRR